MWHRTDRKRKMTATSSHEAVLSFNFSRLAINLNIKVAAKAYLRACLIHDTYVQNSFQ